MPEKQPCNCPGEPVAATAPNSDANTLIRRVGHFYTLLMILIGIMIVDWLIRIGKSAA